MKEWNETCSWMFAKWNFCNNNVKTVKAKFELQNFCTSSDDALYICTKFCESISKGFTVTDLNSRVNARVVTNVDARWTDIHTDTCRNKGKTGSLHIL